MTSPATTSPAPQNEPTAADPPQASDRERLFWNERAREAHSALDPAAYTVTEHSRFDAAMPWLPFLGVPRLVDALLAAVGDVRGKTVLDLGCGSGFLSVLMARRGAKRVIGIDVSEEQLAIARFRAATSGVAPGILDFRAASADRIDFADESIDIVVGAFVLHHLDLPNAAPEIRRVLKNGGAGAFVETSARNPLLMAARSLIVGRFGIPKHGSADERPLGRQAERILGDLFPGTLAIRTPVLVSMRLVPAYVAPLRPKPIAWLFRAVDEVLGMLPPARRWSYYNVVEFRKGDS
jgi:ubiquinone/menaquinone biosynthesis C-methylase UbiE